MSSSEYDQLREAQGNLCAICHRPQAFALGVDHDHATGRIRGLLCRNCNQGLGYFADDPERLLRAISYLNRP